jgi:hypothetical protein
MESGQEKNRFPMLAQMVNTHITSTSGKMERITYMEHVSIMEEIEVEK